MAKPGPGVYVPEYIFGVPHDSYCMLSYLLHMCIIESDWSIRKCTLSHPLTKAKDIKDISIIEYCQLCFFFPCHCSQISLNPLMGRLNKQIKINKLKV